MMSILKMQKYSQFVNIDKFVVYKQAVQGTANWSGDSLQTVRTVAYRMGEGVKNGRYVATYSGVELLC